MGKAIECLFSKPVVRAQKERTPEAKKLPSLFIHLCVKEMTAV
jgi:hypothetical protein